MAKKASMAVVMAVSAMSLVLSTPSCSKKAADSAWKADIEVIDGVKTVRNPETPRYGTFAFDLVEDLAIGDEKDDAYFFPERATVNIDDEGTFYVCDFGNQRVQVYGRNGSFVRTLGRVGQGPGEYAFPSGVSLDESGNILISDARSLVAFSGDGLFLKKIPLKAFLTTMMPGPRGTIIGTTQPNPRAEGGPKNELLQLGPDGDRLRTLAEFPVYGVSKDGILKHLYTGGIYYCRRSADSLYYGFSLEYRVHVVDGDGRALLVFSKPENALPITSEEADVTREKGSFIWSGRGDARKADLGMPDHRPFFSNFLSDDVGRLYVIRFKPILERDTPARDIDVFSKDGIYLYRMTWPFVPQVIKGGCLYEARWNEDAGLTKIIRHRISNWGDFRSE
jgi:hypothetical protein